MEKISRMFFAIAGLSVLMSIPASGLPPQRFSTTERVIGATVSDWAFMTAWDLSTGGLQISPEWYNGSYTWDFHQPARNRWVAKFIYQSSAGQTRELQWSYVQAHVQFPTTQVRIPGGTNSGIDPDFGPYSLTVDTFYMDKHEVTKALWDEVYTWAIANGYTFDNVGSGKAGNHPVHSINWYDAVKWCNARSEKEGKPAVYLVNGTVYRTGQHDDVVQSAALGYRLPTDVEWQYAARGGAANRRFPWGDTITHSHANYRSTTNDSYDVSPTRGYHPAYSTGGVPYTAPVGSFPANGYGLHDMVGNVSEKCFDWLPGAEGWLRIFRSGAWGNWASHCRVGGNGGGSPPDSSEGKAGGFRTVLSKDQ